MDHFWVLSSSSSNKNEELIVIRKKNGTKLSPNDISETGRVVDNEDKIGVVLLLELLDREDICSLFNTLE